MGCAFSLYRPSCVRERRRITDVENIFELRIRKQVVSGLAGYMKTGVTVCNFNISMIIVVNIAEYVIKQIALNRARSR